VRGAGAEAEREVKLDRGVQVGVVVAVAGAIALVGLVAGVEGTGRAVTAYVTDRPPQSEAPEARSYADMRERMYGPNGALQPTWFQRLGGPDLFAPVTQSPAEREAALARRATRRAYNGAPPVIPHPIDQIATTACLTCHERGARLGTQIAPRMSHEPRANCVQCHVTSADPRPGADTPPAPETTFVGLATPGPGTRAWDGAPPTIPHTTWMRERCDSCHGAFGANGLKTTHPWRQSCTQCHAPSAVLDQRPPVAGLRGTP
jgi:nitrate reductase (cytochrome), electron transfer subunit